MIPTRISFITLPRCHAAAPLSRADGSATQQDCLNRLSLTHNMEQSLHHRPTQNPHPMSASLRSNLFFLATILLSLSPLRTSTASAQSSVPSRKEDFHLYLLIGQSNMAGRGVVPPDQKPHPRVLKLDKENKWVPSTEPLHFDKPIAGAALGTSFAATMAETAPEPIVIGLIPCAVGGTPLSRWEKDGDLWKQALARLEVARQHGTLKGILWHQGEADSTTSLAPTYGKRLAAMVSDLRTQISSPNMPFVAGHLGTFIVESNPNGTPNLWRKINEEIDSLPSNVPHAAVVPSEGLGHKGDRLHFDTAALRDFGKRYAEAMQRLHKSSASPR